MQKLDLERYGIADVKEIVYNPNYEQLFEEEMNPELNGYEKAQLTAMDTVSVMTGIYTGRSPKDKYIVKDDITKDTVWWTSPEVPNDNRPISVEVWNDLKANTANQLSGKRLFVVDGYCGGCGMGFAL